MYEPRLCPSGATGPTEKDYYVVLGGGKGECRQVHLSSSKVQPHASKGGSCGRAKKWSLSIKQKKIFFSRILILPLFWDLDFFLSDALSLFCHALFYLLFFEGDYCLFMRKNCNFWDQCPFFTFPTDSFSNLSIWLLTFVNGSNKTLNKISV